MAKRKNADRITDDAVQLDALWYHSGKAWRGGLNKTIQQSEINEIIAQQRIGMEWGSSATVTEIVEA